MVLRLSFACWDYDRMKAIEDGRVRPEGIELTFLNYRVEETLAQPGSSLLRITLTGCESVFFDNCDSKNSISRSCHSLHTSLHSIKTTHPSLPSLCFHRGFSVISRYISIRIQGY